MQKSKDSLKASFENVNIFTSLDIGDAMTGEGAFIQINKAFAYLTQDIVLMATLLSADNLCKQFGSRSEPTEHVS